MPVVNEKTYELADGEVDKPILWLEKRELPAIDVGDEVMNAAMAPNRSLKSWGHTGPLRIHWLGIRTGTPLHTDPGFDRYTHHLVLRNDGFRTRGLDDFQMPILEPGSLYCLDGQSPHQVLADPRLVPDGRVDGFFKLDLVVDTDHVLEPDSAWELLAPFLERPVLTPTMAARLAAKIG